VELYQYENNEVLVEFDKQTTLDVVMPTMDGKKVRGQNKIIAPIRSSPKVYSFKSYEDIVLGPGMSDIINRIVTNTSKKIANIEKIKSQYGGDIKFEYDVKGIYKPLEHQKIMYNAMMFTDSCCINADPGTCKTGSYLWMIDQRIKTGIAKKALVITLSQVKENVLAEMADQVPHLRGVVLDGADNTNKVINKKYKSAKKNVDYDIYISNYESMRGIVDLIPDYYFDIIVCDEAHRIGSHTSAQTKSIIKKFEHARFKYIVSGSIHSNNLMSFFMPFRFLGPDNLPYAKYEYFRRKYMYAVDPDEYVWVPVKGSKEAVSQIVGNITIKFTKEECLDLPDLIFEKINCQMTGAHKKVYDEMRDTLIATVEDMCSKCINKEHCNNSCSDTIGAKSAFVLIGKLRQVACGFYINTRFLIDDEQHEIDASNTILMDSNPKMDTLIQVLNNIPQNRLTIIWTTYKMAVKLISERVEKAFGKDSYLTCVGSQNAYDQSLKFKGGKHQFMIANPSKMGVGLNMQYSNYQVFFNNSYSFIQRDQAISRQYRQGQKSNVTVFDIVLQDTIDERLLKVLMNKEDLSLTLSEMSRVIKKK